MGPLEYLRGAGTAEFGGEAPQTGPEGLSSPDLPHLTAPQLIGPARGERLPAAVYDLLPQGGAATPRVQVQPLPGLDLHAVEADCVGPRVASQIDIEEHPHGFARHVAAEFAKLAFVGALKRRITVSSFSNSVSPRTVTNTAPEVSPAASVSVPSLRER